LRIGASYAVAFSSDGRRLAVVSKAVSVFDLDRRKRLFQARPVPQLSDVQFSPDGRTLLVKNTRGRVVLLSAENGTVIRTLDEGGREGCAPRFSSCGGYVLDGSWDGDLRLREVSSGTVLWGRQFPGEMVEAIHPLARRRLWAVLHAPKAATDDAPPAPPFLTLWKHPVRGRKPVAVIRPRRPFICDSVPSPDGRYLLIVYDAPPDKLTIVDLKTGRARRAIRVKSRRSA
jgi:WD40 repeat protein